jgi:hypothetical protein
VIDVSSLSREVYSQLITFSNHGLHKGVHLPALIPLDSEYVCFNPYSSFAYHLSDKYGQVRQ